MSDRHEMQAAGTHPAPCARHCESTAYEIEIRRLRHDIERHVGIATEATQEVEQLRAEIERLNSCLRYEQNRADRVGTHGPGCETWGPAHYECVVLELAASREREARMRCALRNLLALDVDHQRGADDEDVCAEVSEARAALAENRPENVQA